jgi:hypothetical protein
MVSSLIRNVLLRSRAKQIGKWRFAPHAASQHNKVMLRRAALCCFAAELHAASQPSYVLLQITV